MTTPRTLDRILERIKKAHTEALAASKKAHSATEDTLDGLSFEDGFQAGRVDALAEIYAGITGESP